MDTSGNGFGTLTNNTAGEYSVAIGYAAMNEGTAAFRSVAIGAGALQQTQGPNNIGIGYGAGTFVVDGTYNIEIGNVGNASDYGVIRLGDSHQTKTYIGGINGTNVSGGTQVFINSSGQLGTVTSSKRFKNNIKSMGNTSDKLMQLRPVTFRYNDKAEKGAHPLQYGLIAEEVAKVYPDLVQYDKQGKPFTIYYHLLTPMLLNELQKEHRENVAMKAAQKTSVAKIVALESAHKAEIADLKATLQAQKSELAALKQSQQQQMKVLAKLADQLEAAQNKATHPAVFVQH